VVLKETAELTMRVSQVLALARAEAGSYQPVRQHFALAPLAEDLQEKAGPLAQRNGNQLNVTVQEGEAYTDRDMLLQIVSNLVTNACKFTLNGMVNATLQFKGDALEVEIADTGRGIPLAQQAHV